VTGDDDIGALILNVECSKSASYSFNLSCVIAVESNQDTMNGGPEA